MAQTEMEKGLVSIVLPIRRGENISEVISSIALSSYSHYEIIVVDRNEERSSQRNWGIRKAKGEFILILDSDQHLSKYLLEECVITMTYGGLDALYIPETIITEGLFAYIRNWERQFYNATPVDCVRFVRADNCVLFDIFQTGPEDSDWDRRTIGKRGITQNVFYHKENVGIFSYFKKKAYYAKSMKRFSRRHKKDKVLNFWWRCFGVFFENGKWVRVLKRPDLMITVWFILFVRGVVYYAKR